MLILVLVIVLVKVLDDEVEGVFCLLLSFVVGLYVGFVVVVVVVVVDGTDGKIGG